MLKASLKKTLLYNLVRNPFGFKRRDLLKLYFAKDFVNECQVRGASVKIAVKSKIELFRCESYNTKEPETLDWIDRFQPNETLFDIGGNIGVYTLYAASKGCRVFTFEPESQNYARLVNNISLNGFTEARPYCMGIGKKSEITVLYLTSLNAGDSQHQVGAMNELYDRSFEKITQGCVVFSLNDLCFKHGMPIPDHIKIDVDGLEPEIIEGAEMVLKDPKVKTLLIEINKGPEETPDLQKRIEALGYTLEVTSKREFRTDKLSARNYIFKKTQK